LHCFWRPATGGIRAVLYSAATANPADANVFAAVGVPGVPAVLTSLLLRLLHADVVSAIADIVAASLLLLIFGAAALTVAASLLLLPFSLFLEFLLMLSISADAFVPTVAGVLMYKKIKHIKLSDQGWANLDQASKHLEVFRFRDLSPTPIP
jgi:hypothetical protein